MSLRHYFTNIRKALLFGIIILVKLIAFAAKKDFSDLVTFL